MADHTIDPSKLFPGLAEGIADGSIPIRISLHTAPPPDTTEVSGGTGYPVVPSWVNGGTSETIVSWSFYQIGADDEDWDIDEDGQAVPDA